MSKIQTFLTGFSTDLIGSAKQSLRAIFEKSRDGILGRTIGELALQFRAVIPAQLIDSLNESKRKRVYCNEVTFWAWTGQMLQRNSSCSSAVTMVQSWFLGEKAKRPSSKTGSYTKARKRLPMAMINGINEHVVEFMDKRIRPQDLWKGMQVKSIDGSSTALLDTPENQKEYPQSKNQKPGCGAPRMKFLAIYNHATGAWQQHVTSHPHRNDHRVARSLLHHFGPGDLCLGDTAFGSYESFYRLGHQGAHGLMKLHQGKSAVFKKMRKKGENERLVVWKKPSRKPPTSDLSDQQWRDIPKKMTVRYIMVDYINREGKKDTAYLVTTLLDQEKYPWEELAKLYLQRWEIEVRLRDVKTTMGLEELRVKTPEMARKSLAMGLLAYNLVKSLHQEAAIEKEEPLHLLSFSGTLESLASTLPNYHGHKKHPQKLKVLHAELVETIGSKRLNIRPGRWEPRRIKKRPKAYPFMMKPRHKYHQDYDADKAA